MARMFHTSSSSSPLLSTAIRCSSEGNGSKSRLATRSVASKPSSQGIDETRDRIKKLFDDKSKIQLSASPYDTAWVAMVPSPANSLVKPCFPECVNWILDNQRDDGSWGLNFGDINESSSNLLVKDTMSSTLACILALKRWGIGDQHIHNALGFMGRNSDSVTDSTQRNPVGFDVIFPAMIQTSVKDFNLNLPLKSADIDAMIRNRESVLNNLANPPHSKGRDAYLAYISEGIGDLQDWESAMKFQRMNGSLFNSPSATAAALIHLRGDAGSLRYLRSVVGTSDGNNVSVPAIYPYGIHNRLCLIDAVDQLGIGRHFREEVNLALNEIYRSWEEGDEEIFLDCTTCAMAFRLLRLNGYPVSPGKFLASIENETIEGYLNDERAVLELHKASKVIYPEETILEHQHSWTTRSLTNSHQDALQNPVHSNRSRACKYVSLQADMERLRHRRSIEQFCVDNTRTLKSSFRCSSFGNQDMLKLAVEDFNLCQSLHQEELAHLMRWLKEYKLDGMRLAKEKMGYCFFSAAGTFFDPSLSQARISWAKHSLLTALIDEIYDMYGTLEEQLNLIDLMERWDVAGPKVDFCSERVESLYWALHSAICETVENAFAFQGRSVMDHVVEIWLDMMRSQLRESEWYRTNTQPTLEQYMSSARVSFALGPIVLPALYLLGPKLSNEVAKGPEVHNLYNVMSICGRYLNDRISKDKDAEQGNWNAVSLRMSEGGRSAEESDEDIKGLAEDLMKELLRLVLEEKNSSRVPKECRELFWYMSSVLHFSYQKEDGFGLVELGRNFESLIEKPISLVDPYL
ncbi:Ent-kaur-16-ene synthase, chloroplastic [Linum perenne]